MQPHNDRIDQEFLENDRERSARAEETLWLTVGRLYHWRRFIIGVTGAVAVAAVVITLMMPNVYRATARVLVPESGGGLSAAVLRNLPSAAASLLGGAASGDYIRYLAILNSRTVLESVVDTFVLVRIYDLEGVKNPREDAISLLSENLEVTLDEKLDYLSVSVLDTDPQRAADMSNFLVSKLNEVNARLSAQNAGNYRSFIERRFRETETAIDSVLTATQAFQQRYGVYDLPAQTQGFFEQVARMRAQAIEAEIQYEVLADQYGQANSSVATARRLARAANEKYQNALSGQERLLPVAQDVVPEVARRYAELEMERRIQFAILEIVRPMYEQARLQEEQKMEAVQVLDTAVPPVKKAGPRRSIIVVVATLSAFLVACVYVLLFGWWQRSHASIAHRLTAVVRETKREESQVS